MFYAFVLCLRFILLLDVIISYKVTTYWLILYINYYFFSIGLNLTVNNKIKLSLFYIRSEKILYHHKKNYAHWVHNLFINSAIKVFINVKWDNIWEICWISLKFNNRCWIKLIFFDYIIILVITTTTAATLWRQIKFQA